MLASAQDYLFKCVEPDFYDIDGYVDHNRLRARLGVKENKLARAINKSQRSLQKNPHSENIQKELRKIVYIFALLKEMMESEQKIAIWLRAPNPDYDGLTPLEVIMAGKSDSIINYLKDVQKGALG